MERGALSKIWSERGVLTKKLAGARSADILSRSVERCFEANMGGARSAKIKFPGALYHISQLSGMLNESSTDLRMK